MKSFEAEATINAPADVIWDLITDGPNIPNWDPGMDRVEGTIAPGEKIKVFTKLSPDRAFPVTVTEWKPNESMIWTGGMGFLFKGIRTMVITPKGDAHHFHLREQFSGPLLPVFGGTIPDLTPAFNDYVQGLNSTLSIW